MKQFKFSVFLFLIVGIAFLSSPDLQANPKQDCPIIKNVPIDVTIDVTVTPAVMTPGQDIQMIPAVMTPYHRFDMTYSVETPSIDKNPNDLSYWKSINVSSETAIGMVPPDRLIGTGNIYFKTAEYNSSHPPGFTYSVITEDDEVIKQNSRSLQVVNDTPTIRKL